MNWFLAFFWLRFKQIAQQMTLWILLLTTVVVALIPVINHARGDTDNIRIAVVNEDSGSFSAVFIDAIRDVGGMEYVMVADSEEALRALAAGRYEGVIIIDRDFTEQMEALVFNDMFTFYVSPTSSIGMVLVEIFSEKVVEIWANEVLLADYMDFRAEKGLTADEAVKELTRAGMDEASLGDPLILIDYHVPDGEWSLEEPPQSNGPQVIAQGVLWLCALAGFFILLSSRWVIDQRRTAIGERMLSLGVSPALTSLAAGMAVVVYCFFALLIMLAISGFYVSISLGLFVQYLLAGLLYFLAMAGFAVMISALVRTSIDLMIVAPMFTMVNAVLGGMFAALPEWAVVLERFSLLLPGRLLNQALVSQQWVWLLVAAMAYFAAGIGVGTAVTGKGYKENGVRKGY
jgi:hypothetical protein